MMHLNFENYPPNRGLEHYVHLGVEPKNRGKTAPKMDGENNGKPYEQMDDLGVPLFLEAPILRCHVLK